MRHRANSEDTKQVNNAEEVVQIIQCLESKALAGGAARLVWQPDGAENDITRPLLYGY